MPLDLLDLLASTPAARGVLAAVASGRRALVRGAQGSSTALFAGALCKHTKRPVLLVVAHLDDADEAVDELTGLGVAALRMPALEALPGESSVSLDLFAERIGVVRQLAQAQATSDDSFARVIIAPIAALMQPVPGPDQIARLATTLTTGQRRDPSELAAWLTHAGYERVETIEEPGQFALRGGIIDVLMPAGSVLGVTGPASAVRSLGVRLDFFGDELERISEIDLDTMGSDRALRSVDIVCASLETALAEPQKAQGKSPRPGTIDTTGGDSGVSFVTCIPENAIALLAEPMELTEQARGYFERLTDPRIFGPPAVFKAIQERFGTKRGGLVEIAQFSSPGSGADAQLDLPVRPLPELSRDASQAVGELAHLALGETGSPPSQVLVCCQNAGELSRLRELLTSFAPQAAQRIDSRELYLHRGFVLERDGEPDVCLVPYHELLHRYESRGRGATRTVAGAPVRSARAIDAFLEFGEGDFVVHRDHGIAVFRGLVTMKPRDVKRDVPVVLPSDRPSKSKKDRRRPGADVPDPDEGLEEYLALEFAGQSKLYVPASTIDQVQKYVGGMRGAPTLSALGGTRWKKQKEAVAESVKDLASELLRIRAARESLPGVRYPQDTTWQTEFEAEFPFAETEDQLAALAQIKRDMASERPMDRLLCGDVGYGKTEVAIRAAFKAAEFGKQVAVLVPTTVLAEQHERTFRSRFADYPFKVASISRFKTTKEVNDTLAALRRGEVDVIIGTHRLLSKDVKFADLGLVIIDEEQRFGVEHKERLLSLRLTVDVLTLSATPIPRTLHMSMLGLRDISNLTTPPVDRRAVVTEVIPYNTRRIQQAIARELAREGQVFFVHNRVHNIRSVADEIQKLAPDAKIVIGHGQMPDDELEQVMLRFMRRQADILVSTTIIESGIDIPTANTMFINDADRFGLAELHQLRGRVGRYKHRAYCYMLLSPDRTTTEKAVKRLKAIEEFSMLGAGFKIATRDLELRGAGNILGPEQSGNIAAVGYEMYCQLLDRAVKELRSEPTHVVSQTSVELGVTGMIPKRYIPSDQRRMGAYRRIALAASPDELARTEQELAQAYGSEIPAATQRLLALAALRVSASSLGVRSIAVRGSDVVFRARPEDAAPLALQLSTPPSTSSPSSALPPRTPADRERSAPQLQITVLPPKPPDALSEVYVRPPPAYMEPVTLLRVLVRRLSDASSLSGGNSSSTSSSAPTAPLLPTVRTSAPTRG